jgi:hypothetical protein
MVTMVETWARLVRTRRDRQYSKAVEASKPRVELSQHPTAPRVTIVSAIETRFFSPPETPRINYIYQINLTTLRKLPHFPHAYPKYVQCQISWQEYQETSSYTHLSTSPLVSVSASWSSTQTQESVSPSTSHNEYHPLIINNLLSYLEEP